MKRPWIEASVTELADAMAQHQVSACDLVERYLDQMAAHNRAGQRINAVLEVNPDAWFVANGLDAERSRQGVRGPLHGIPILVKDNIDTADRLHTSAGSLALATSYAQQDAPLVSALREAGAIILGKANMTEWANFMARRMPNGYSSRGGQVRNPYGPGRLDPSGSSSGSAAGVAAGFAAAAIGTETSGSILSPASQQSLVGLKPTLGLISRRGVIPISPSQDTAGPITRSVADAALLLTVLAGFDAADPATAPRRDAPREDYTAGLRDDGLRGARIGFPTACGSWPPGMRQRAADELAALGATVVLDVPAPEAESLPPWDVLRYEFGPALDAYLEALPPTSPVHSVRDVVRFNQAHPRACLRYGQAHLLFAAASGSLTAAAYWEARRRDLAETRDRVAALFLAHDLDALAFCGADGCALGAKAGFPSLTIPAGYREDGNPVGLTLMGLAFTDGRLLQLGFAYERGTQHRTPPDLSTP